MNSCVLMAQVVRDPELRSTQEGTSIASMFVEFPSSREGEAPGTLKVDGWGNLAEEMKNSYHIGDNIIIEGRLSMNVFEQEGYKEKRATLVASRIYPVGGVATTNFAPAATSQPSYAAPVAATPSTPNNVVDFASTLQSQPAPATVSTTNSTPEEVSSDGDNNEDWDRIPF